MGVVGGLIIGSGVGGSEGTSCTGNWDGEAGMEVGRLGTFLYFLAGLTHVARDNFPKGYFSSSDQTRVD
uniref:Uncharacterized protein n=1 Tax=Lepeophtheirus salmonis TaxID=72036 RepID=A0A0K2VDU1_LEPSM